MRASLGRAARMGVILASLLSLGACAAEYGYGPYGYGYSYGYGYPSAFEGYSGPYYTGRLGIVAFGGPYYHARRYNHFAHGFHFAGYPGFAHGFAGHPGHVGGPHGFAGHPAVAAHAGAGHFGDHSHA